MLDEASAFAEAMSMGSGDDALVQIRAQHQRVQQSTIEYLQDRQSEEDQVAGAGSHTKTVGPPVVPPSSKETHQGGSKP